MLDFIFEALATPGPVSVGIGLGFLAALAAWFLLPETIDRASVGGWLVAIGFVGGLVFSLPGKKEKR